MVVFWIVTADDLSMNTPQSPQGPIVEFRMTTLEEPTILTQGPFGLEIERFSTTKFDLLETVIGPLGVRGGGLVGCVGGTLFDRSGSVGSPARATVVAVGTG